MAMDYKYFNSGGGFLCRAAGWKAIQRTSLSTCFSLPGIYRRRLISASYNIAYLVTKDLKSYRSFCAPQKTN